MYEARKSEFKALKEFTCAAQRRRRVDACVLLRRHYMRSVFLVFT